jgi:hypothetical protein
MVSSVGAGVGVGEIALGPQATTTAARTSSIPAMISNFFSDILKFSSIEF